MRVFMSVRCGQTETERANVVARAKMVGCEKCRDFQRFGEGVEERKKKAREVHIY